MDTTILYYTHNLLSEQLLKKTTQQAIEHARINNCHLIFISHFPIIKSHFVERLIEEDFYQSDYNPQTGKTKILRIYDFLVKAPIIEEEYDNVENYVVGKLPYNSRSIYQQLVFGLSKVQSENVILFEHDCFYPKEYVSAVRQTLDSHEFSWCSKRLMCGKNGYYELSNFYISECSSKTHLLFEIYEEKLSLTDAGQKPSMLEPVLVDKTERGRTNEVIMVSEHSDAGLLLPESQCILDIKHGLNTTGTLAIEGVCDHIYWGRSKQYIDLFPLIPPDKEILWSYGLNGQY